MWGLRRVSYFNIHDTRYKHSLIRNTHAVFFAMYSIFSSGDASLGIWKGLRYDIDDRHSRTHHKLGVRQVRVEAYRVDLDA